MVREDKVLYELLSFDIDPERWDEYVEFANNVALPMFVDQFGFRLVGMWEPVPARNMGWDETASATSLHWMLAWESEEERYTRWTELRASDAFQVARAAAIDPATGRSRFHHHRRVTLLRAWPISPLQ
jgi:hypothetical protein